MAKIRQLPPREISEDEQALRRKRRRNRDYFETHRSQILSKHSGKHIVVVGDQEVCAFERRSELYAFIASLDKRTKGSDFLAPGPFPEQHVRSTGYRRLVQE